MIFTHTYHLFVSQALVGLREAGKVRLPQQEFDDEKVRYHHRFLPFNVVVTPPPVSYHTFVTMTDLSNFPQVRHKKKYLKFVES